MICAASATMSRRSVKASILPAAIVEKFVAGADGVIEPLTTGSTQPVALTATHAGIFKVQRYSFDLLRG
jgi:hypothetical protein